MAQIRRENLHSEHLGHRKFYAIRHPFPHHLNVMSGLRRRKKKRERANHRSVHGGCSWSQRASCTRPQETSWAGYCGIDNPRRQKTRTSTLLSAQVTYPHAQQIKLQRLCSRIRKLKKRERTISHFTAVFRDLNPLRAPGGCRRRNFH